jgi:hypothetical protein
MAEKASDPAEGWVSGRSGALAKVGLVEIIAKGIHKGIQL